MNKPVRSRRHFLKASATTAAALAIPSFNSATLLAQDAKASEKNDRPLVGCIGTGSRWRAVGNNAMKFGDCVAVCDVDAKHASDAQQLVKNKQGRDVEAFEDYRKVLDRKDVEVVTIVTPDHWHTKIAIEAMQAGKDVYCEKPLTLTIEEGKQIAKVQQETGRVFQVGTQQRSEMGLKFLQAVALVKAGRIGDVERVTCAIGGSPTSGPLEKTDPPSGLNWDFWLGQAPKVDYIKRRCHYEFRWWYEYSGGKLTDWGAHHVDIATWAIGMDHSGPISLDPVMVKHPVAFKDGYPAVDNQYNTATEFDIKVMYGNGVEMRIRHDAKDLGFDNGVMFEGTKGRFLVNRGKIVGKPVEDLADQPLPEDALIKLYKGKQPGDHMRNFFECLKTREQPISDVHTHHRALTTCHLANIAIRLNRSLKWDPAKEMIVGDAEANAWQGRAQREGFEINV